MERRWGRDDGRVQVEERQRKWNGESCEGFLGAALEARTDSAAGTYRDMYYQQSCERDGLYLQTQPL